LAHTTSLSFRTVVGNVSLHLEVAVRELAIAGWTAQDARAPEPPKPVFHRAASARLTHAETIEVSSGNSTGEVEFILVESGGRLWAGAGSDHTDRSVAAYDIAAAKQICEKPVAGGLWLFAEVKDHWKELLLRSWLVDGDRREMYQEGSVRDMLAPAELIAAYTDGRPALPDNTVIFSGSLPVIGEVRPAGRFEFEFVDPVRSRTLTHGYDVEVLRATE
jgi:hypothetical protein